MLLGHEHMISAGIELLLEHLELVFERLALTLQLLLLLDANAFERRLELERLGLLAPLDLLLPELMHLREFDLELAQQLLALLLELLLERLLLHVLFARLLDELASVLVEIAAMLDEVAFAVLGQLALTLLLFRVHRLLDRLRHCLSVDDERFRDRLARSRSRQLLLQRAQVLATVDAATVATRQAHLSRRLRYWWRWWWWWWRHHFAALRAHRMITRT